MFLFDGHHQLTVVFYKICIAETPTHNVFLQPFTTDIVPREDIIVVRNGNAIQISKIHIYAHTIMPKQLFKTDIIKTDLIKCA